MECQQKAYEKLDKKLFNSRSANVSNGEMSLPEAVAGQRQAETSLRESNEQFETLVSGVRDYALFILDPQGQVATWNTGAERLKGYKAAEIVGQHLSRFYTQDDVDRGWPDEEIRRATEEDRLDDEGWRIRKDGSAFWANVVITGVRDETGTLRGFAKVTRDLTEQRKSEESTRRLLREEAACKAAEDAADEIDRQREELHVTLASIGDGVIATDDKADVTFLNSVVEQLTGWIHALGTRGLRVSTARSLRPRSLQRHRAVSAPRKRGKSPGVLRSVRSLLRIEAGMRRLSETGAAVVLRAVPADKPAPDGNRLCPPLSKPRSTNSFACDCGICSGFDDSGVGRRRTWVGDGGARHAGRDADRLRQESLLPTAGPDAIRRDAPAFAEDKS